MFSMSSLSRNQQHIATIYALKKLLLYESDNNKIHLLSLLHQLNIETDSIECNNQNYNNSYVPIETDNLSALYAHYQIDPRIYPPPDLQLYKTIQSSRLKNSSMSEQRRNSSNNSSRKSRSRRKKQKRLKSNRNKKKNNNKQSETDNFHYRNMITVRRISYHDMLNSQMMMEKESKYKQNNIKNEKIKNEWNKKTKSANLIENKTQRYNTFSTGFKSSPPLVELHRSPIQSIINKSLGSPSTTNSNTNILTIPLSNTLFPQRKFKKKMSNSTSMTEFKVTSLRDSSASSLISTQLLAAAYNQTKADVILATSTTPGSQIDLGSSADNSRHVSTTNSSIVPHFSSTIAPHVPHHISSSTIAIANISKTKSIVAPTLTNENIQDLVDQLKTCIVMLSHLLQKKTEHEKQRIPNVKSYSNEKKSRRKKKQSQSSSLSLTSTSDHLKFSKNSLPNENNLIFEDITVRQCNSFNDQQRKNYQNKIPVSYNDQHEELKRCLLVYCRDRGKNINTNEKHASLSQSLPNNSIDILNISKSTLILSEEDDEYESFNELLRMSSL